MKQAIFRLLLLALSGLAGSSFGAGSTNDDVTAIASHDEKAAWLTNALSRWAEVNSWLIEYELSPIPLAQGYSVHRLDAISAPGRFYSCTWHFDQSHAWQADPYCQEILINGGKALHRWPFSNFYSETSLTNGATLPGSVPLDIFFLVAPSWPLADYRMPADLDSGTTILPIHAVYLPEYRLFRGTVEIAGEKCVVFDRAGLDRIWLAADRGFCVMQREQRNPRTETLQRRLRTQQMKEVKAGLWLPEIIELQRFDSGQNGNPSDIETRSQIKVLRCLLNENVPDSCFIAKIPAGSLKSEGENRFTQVNGGGEDLLDKMVNFMVDYKKLPTNHLRRSLTSTWLLLGFSAGFAAGVILARPTWLKPRRMA